VGWRGLLASLSAALVPKTDLEGWRGGKEGGTVSGIRWEIEIGREGWSREDECVLNGVQDMHERNGDGVSRNNHLQSPLPGPVQLTGILLAMACLPRAQTYQARETRELVHLARSLADIALSCQCREPVVSPAAKKLTAKISGSWIHPTLPCFL
jgi:hypothetical protein